LGAREGETLAAVALVFRGDPVDPELLFIERAEREGDPWSGQMAFPGGRVEKDDRSVREAAQRETIEEVGLDLSGAEVLGRLDDQGGRRAGARRSLRIAAYAFHCNEPGSLEINDEVQTAMWVPYSNLLDPERRVDFEFGDYGGSFAGIRVGHSERHIVWGLTRRILRSLVELMGERLP
jgi:8-oxo-dGTP pyrophosphatase MutT (NUDIX family)